jgi:molecular chaperone GrpE
VTHETLPDVTEPTCVSVMRRGYLLGDRLLRPAMVAVADPE